MKLSQAQIELLLNRAQKLETQIGQISQYLAQQLSVLRSPMGNAQRSQVTAQVKAAQSKLKSDREQLSKIYAELKPYGKNAPASNKVKPSQSSNAPLNMGGVLNMGGGHGGMGRGYGYGIPVAVGLYGVGGLMCERDANGTMLSCEYGF